MLRAGSLRHSIVIQRLDIQKNEVGDDISVWTDFACVRASIRMLTGGESFSSLQIYDQAMHEIVIRYIPGINSKMRIVFEDRLFDIKSINNLHEKNKKLIIKALENGSRLQS